MSSLFDRIADASGNVPPLLASQGQLAVDLRKRISFRDEQFLRLQNKWSGWLIAWISTSLIFQFGTTIMVGLGYMNFQQYQWFISIVMLQNFAQIIGMGLIVIKFLYDNKA